MNNTKRYFNREDISPLDLALIWGSMRLEQLLPSCDHMDPENEAKIWQTWATSWNQILSSNMWASKSSHAWIYPIFFKLSVVWDNTFSFSAQILAFTFWTRDSRKGSINQKEYKLQDFHIQYIIIYLCSEKVKSIKHHQFAMYTILRTGNKCLLCQFPRHWLSILRTFCINL